MAWITVINQRGDRVLVNLAVFEELDRDSDGNAVLIRIDPQADGAYPTREPFDTVEARILGTQQGGDR